MVARGVRDMRRIATSFSHDGCVFDVQEFGPPDGEPVVLLHGFPQNSASWSAVGPELARAGFRVLAPDQRGYSAGARPHRARDYRLDLLASDVVALLDSAAIDRAHLVGHDVGGTVAWGAAMWHPERLTSLTVLSAPHPEAFYRSLRRDVLQVLRSWYMLLFLAPALPEWLLAPRTPLRHKLFTSMLIDSGMPTDSAQYCASLFARPEALGAAINWYRALRKLPRAQSARSVAVPTLYIRGGRDRYVGRAAAALTADFVSGPYRPEVLADAGHWLPEASAREVTDLLVEHLASNSI